MVFKVKYACFYGKDCNIIISRSFHHLRLVDGLDDV